MVEVLNEENNLFHPYPKKNNKIWLQGAIVLNRGSIRVLQEDLHLLDHTSSCYLQAMCSNGALKAIELTQQLVPNLLDGNEDLHFDLLSLHFVDLICSRKCTEALEFAQAKLTPFGKINKYVEKLEDFMALLAYEEPEKSPMFHLLSPEYRQNVADGLNRAILAHANLPSYSSMERLIQQATVVRQFLHQEAGKEGPPPFSLKAFLKS
ncbi:glucose-induced degradation protein 8 homolog isoform X2 [Asparagus officinalis]|uniref:glucose-induced degradation protein 8 homolog isoform X2 n=1 Tax=Asparagus officinalis TaxID=4686 RepID=UPI00098E7B86|nr:glucose-induced degradation protein 8 homolog isoform X2 [Asparagus officinalis]